MSELIKALGRFVARDLIYVIGGTTVILSFLYLFNCLSSDELPLAYSLFGAGLAYVVGYAIQDLCCLVGLVTMADYFEPNCFVKRLYRRFTREDWCPIERFDTHGLTLQSILVRQKQRTSLFLSEWSPSGKLVPPWGHAHWFPQSFCSCGSTVLAKPIGAAWISGLRGLQRPLGLAWCA